MKTSRRDLLALAGLLGAAGPVATRAGAPAGDWPAIRGRFRLHGGAPLNAANLCPAFASVLDGQAAYAERLNADVGFLNRRAFVREHVASAREDCARHLGVGDPADLAFVRNTSEANAVIVHGLDLDPDDEVVLWRENHATNYRSWHYRHRRRPCVVRSLALPPEPVDTPRLVRAFVAALTPRTRVVSFSHVSNISGRRLPARQLCDAIHAYRPDILVHVDGAQSWGSLALDLDAMGCDSFSASGHKWLCGPRGTGVLMVRRQWARRIHPLQSAYDFGFDYPEHGLQDTARRFENLGQRDTAAYAALGLAVREHQHIGPERIEARVAALTAHAIEAFRAAGLRVVTPDQAAAGHGAVVADLGSPLKTYAAFLALHNAGTAAAFVHGNRVHCSPEGPWQDDEQPLLLRICPHIYNSRANIDAAVELVSGVKNSSLQAVRELLRSLPDLF